MTDRSPARTDLMTARMCSFVLGVGCSLYLSSVIAWCTGIFHPLPSTGSTVIAIAFIAAAISPWLPQRFVSYAVAQMRRTLLGGSAEATRAADWIRGQDPDARQSWWTLVSVGGLASGLAVLLAFPLLGFAQRGHDWLTERMLLPAWGHDIGEVLLIAVAVVPAGIMMGLTAASLHGLFVNPDAPGQSRSLLLGLLPGAALGLLICSHVILPYGSTTQSLLMSVVSFWLLTVLGAVTASRLEKQPGTDPPSFSPPERTGLLPPLIFAGLVSWGVAMGLTGSVWVRVSWFEALYGGTSSSFFLSRWLVFVAIGVGLAGAVAPTRRHSAVGCGFALWLAGAVTAMTVRWLGHASSAGAIAIPGFDVTLRHATLASAAAGVFVGIALPYVKRSLMVFGGGQAVTYAGLMTSVLVGAAVGYHVGTVWLNPQLGLHSVQGLAGLLCMATGGLLLIYEAVRSPWHRVAINVLLFGSLAAVMVLFPRWIREARQSTDGLMLSMRHRVWTARDDADAMTGDVQLASLTNQTSAKSDARDRFPATLFDALPMPSGDRRACVIGDDPGDAAAWQRAGFRTVVQFPHDRSVPSATTSPLGGDGVSIVRKTATAFGSWCAERGTFDMIVLQPVTSASQRNERLWTLEALARVHRRLSPGGQLVVVLPANSLDAATLTIAAAGFSTLFGGDAWWCVRRDGNALREIWLVGQRRPRTADDATMQRSGWRSIRRIAGQRGRVTLHSTRSPRIHSRGHAGGDRGRRDSSLRSLLADP